MKKHIAFLLCLLMTISFVSCKSYEEQEAPSQTENTSAENTSAEISDAEIAMEMYDAAVKGEILVFDERSGEVKLGSLRFPAHDKSVDECGLLRKAVLDIDGDGVNEFIISSPDHEYIVLRYSNSKVYSYRLDISDLHKINTDGTVYWCNSPHTEYGLSKIIFDGEELSVRPLYSLKYVGTSFEYYVEGKLSTEDGYFVYRDQCYPKQEMTFSYFELTRSYPITADQAWNLANEYWDDQDGSRDAGAGTRWTARIVLTDAPNSDTNYYRAAFQEEWSAGGGEGNECLPPFDIQLKDQIFVNAITGEIRASTYDPNGEEFSVEEAIEIVKNKFFDEDIHNEEDGYSFEHDVNAAAPDHIYVIVIRKIVDNDPVFYTREWVDKYTGKIIDGYYL